MIFKTLLRFTLNKKEEMWGQRGVVQTFKTLALHETDPSLIVSTTNAFLIIIQSNLCMELGVNSEDKWV